MTNSDLIEQFRLCERWQDAGQWEILGALYFNRGYVLSAGLCFQRADACRLSTPVAVETENI